ncbi:MAG: aldehyde dehydrogenase family protein [FCB group bacterium]|jgi:acyl-CoA reductase-like NAD-dependent aldehyde dehydrogenase|nr:aldehyde dehydrogenase family protein [FCB group bacterium]
MLRESYPYYLANSPVPGGDALTVTDKYSGDEAAVVALADRDAIDKAIARAADATEPLRQFPAYKRREVLEHCVRRFEERAEELALLLCIEAGKPIRHSRAEVTRLIDTFRIAAAETGRMTGEVLPMDVSERAVNYTGMWKRIPIGPCAFITPWNFPLNLVAHKIAPAIAVGNPFILKPASFTPLGALVIGEILAETDLPQGGFSILPCRSKHADALIEDERIKLLSFTGSSDVGWKLKTRAGQKRVVLELGGNAACIVDADADLDDAVERLVFGAFYQSGQSCISVQRIIIHDSIYDELRHRLCDAIAKLKLGDPEDEKTDLGPLINEAACARLESWIRIAVSVGARVVCGGKTDGVMMEPSLIENVPHCQNLYAEEAFGPIAVLSRFTDFEEALAEANETPYGINAGVFTRDIHKIQRAWDALEVGAVIVNDVPSWRVDHMPYGGVKKSGQGREGIRFAMEEMTEIRLLVLRTP